MKIEINTKASHQEFYVSFAKKGLFNLGEADDVANTQHALDVRLRYLMLYQTFCKIKIEADHASTRNFINVNESTFEVQS